MTVTISRCRAIFRGCLSGQYAGLSRHDTGREAFIPRTVQTGHALIQRLQNKTATVWILDRSKALHSVLKNDCAE